MSHEITEARIAAAQSGTSRTRTALERSSDALVRRQLETGQHDFTNREDWLAACRKAGLVL